MTTERAYLLIEKWFGNNHPLAAQMLPMLIDDASEGKLLHDINYQDEYDLDSDAPECECSPCGCLMSNTEEHFYSADEDDLSSVDYSDCGICGGNHFSQNCPHATEADYWDGDDSHQEG